MVAGFNSNRHGLGQRSCSTSGPASTGMGNRLCVNCVGKLNFGM